MTVGCVNFVNIQSFHFSLDNNNFLKLVPSTNSYKISLSKTLNYNRVATQKFKKIQEHFQNISKFFKNNYSMNIAKKQNH